MSVERSGQCVPQSAERCSPRAQLHLQRLLDSSPPKRLRYHHHSSNGMSPPHHGETGGVTTRTGPSPMAHVTFYQWCIDEQQCMVTAEASARQEIADSAFNGERLQWVGHAMELLRWFASEYDLAHKYLTAALPSSCSAGPPDGPLRSNGRVRDLVISAVNAANDEHSRCTTAMQAVIDIQRRMDAFCAEAMDDRDTLVAALREGEARYAALLENSQDALYASRCAADEADFWEEAATARDNVLENISRELGSLLTDNGQAANEEDFSHKCSNDDEHHGDGATGEGEARIATPPLLASLCEVPSFATAVMDGPRKWSLLLSHKLDTITNMYREAQSRSSIYEAFGFGARELAQDFFTAETAVSEALTDTVALLDAKQRHRELLEGKIKELQDNISAMKDEYRSESAVRDDEVTALWDLLVRTQEEQQAHQAAIELERANKPSVRTIATQTKSAVDMSSLPLRSDVVSLSASVNSDEAIEFSRQTDGVAVPLCPRRFIVTHQDAARLPTARIPCSALTIREGIFRASFALVKPMQPTSSSPQSQFANPASTSSLFVDLKRRVMVVGYQKKGGGGDASTSPTGGIRLTTVPCNDVLGVARALHDLHGLTVNVASGAPLSLRFTTPFERERAYECLKVFQSANDVDVVANTYFGPSMLSHGKENVEDTIGDVTTARRTLIADDDMEHCHDGGDDSRHLCVEASSISLSTPRHAPSPREGGASSLPQAFPVTVYHDASHWHDIRISVVASTVTIEDPVPDEMKADAAIGEDIDILVAALTVKPGSPTSESSALLHDEKVEFEERSSSPGAWVESSVARTTIISKALQQSLLTRGQDSTKRKGTSPGSSWSSSSSRFVVALVNEEDTNIIYFVLVRNELIYAIQHLCLTTLARTTSSAGSSCEPNNATISLRINETSVGFVFANSSTAEVRHGRSVTLFDISPHASSTHDGSPVSNSPRSLEAVEDTEGGLSDVDPCCRWHFTFVVQPRSTTTSAVKVQLPESQISHTFWGREASVTLLRTVNAADRCEFVSACGRSTCCSAVPVHRFMLRTTRSHATLLQSQQISSSPYVSSPGGHQVSYQTRGLTISKVLLSICEEIGVYRSTLDKKALELELTSELGAAPLYLTLVALPSDDETCWGGPRRYCFTSHDNGPIAFHFLVNCKTCSSDKLLFVRERISGPQSSSMNRSCGGGGSASTTLGPLAQSPSLHRTNAAARVSTPWFVQGREVGALTIEGRLL